MAVRTYQELIAWQTGEMFKAEVFRVVEASDAATRDFKFRSRLLEAARGVPSSIVEGFLRFRPREFAHFLDYALGSLGEAERRMHDGVQLRYFTVEDCEAAFRHARRCLTATVRLKQSQARFSDGQRPPRSKPGRRPPLHAPRKRADDKQPHLDKPDNREPDDH